MYDGQMESGGMFRDEVVRMVRLDQESGAALFERTTPKGREGDLSGSDHRFGAILKDQALEKIIHLGDSALESELFLGSVRADRNIVHMGDWSEIIPWSPILISTSN